MTNSIILFTSKLENVIFWSRLCVFSSIRCCYLMHAYVDECILIKAYNYFHMLGFLPISG